MRIQMFALGCISNEQAERNIAHSRSLGIPEIGPADCFGRKLAVVGGGPSVRDHVETLRNWDGDVWAVNGAYRWCEDRGIEAAFFSIDPVPGLAADIGNAPRVYLASVCDPQAFAEADGSIIRTFDIGPGKLLTGATSATATPTLGVLIGYREIHYYGIEGSFSQESHAYRGGIQSRNRMQVVCGGQVFQTDAGMLMQCEFMSAVIRAAPHVFFEHCGGLLRAMVADPDYDVTAVSPDMMATLQPVA